VNAIDGHDGRSDRSCTQKFRIVAWKRQEHAEWERRMLSIKLSCWTFESGELQNLELELRSGARGNKLSPSSPRISGEANELPTMRLVEMVGGMLTFLLISLPLL